MHKEILWEVVHTHTLTHTQPATTKQTVIPDQQEFQGKYTWLSKWTIFLQHYCEQFHTQKGSIKYCRNQIRRKLLVKKANKEKAETIHFKFCTWTGQCEGKGGRVGVGVGVEIANTSGNQTCSYWWINQHCRKKNTKHTYCRQQSIPTKQNEGYLLQKNTIAQNQVYLLHEQIQNWGNNIAQLFQTNNRGARF